MSQNEFLPVALNQLLNAVTARILAPNPALVTEARTRLDSLTKPRGSLGLLEDLAAQLFSIRGGDLSRPLRKAVYVFAADHGIAEEGVSAYPSEVTRQMVLNFVAGGAAINVLARLQDATVRIVDVGVVGDLSGCARLLHRKIRPGSRNMLHEPAMSWDELTQAIETGLDLAQDAAVHGYDMVAPGEMGIGNTTAASALTAALTGSRAERVTGHGTGVSPASFANKVRIVAAILEKHLSEAVDAVPPADLLRRFGGLEIAAMTGFILGSAARGSAIIIDGFISTAAAAFAVALAPATRSFLFAGHLSEEPGHLILLDHLGLVPILQLRMRLGAGTGAVLAMPILEASQRLYHCPLRNPDLKLLPQCGPSLPFSLAVSGGTPFFEVAKLDHRWFLRDGYHRAYRLLQAGLRFTIAVILFVDSIAELGAVEPWFFHEADLRAKRPPASSTF